jgi:sulfur relay protein TusB/DsrH
MTLHLVLTSQTTTLKQLEHMLAPADSLVFIGDGVYALQLLTSNNWSHQNRCYFRTTDARQRGLPDSLQDNIGAIAIDDKQWVELCLSHPRTLSWKP